MLRYATAEPACVWEAGLIKIRRHSLASQVLMRNNFEKVKCIIKFYISSRNERCDAIKTSLIFINNTNYTI